MKLLGVTLLEPAWEQAVLWVRCVLYMPMTVWRTFHSDLTSAWERGLGLLSLSAQNLACHIQLIFIGKIKNQTLPFVWKALSKLWIKFKVPQLSKEYLQKNLPLIHTSWWAQSFVTTTRFKTRVSPFTTPFQHCTGNLDNSVRRENIYIWNKMAEE